MKFSPCLYFIPFRPCQFPLCYLLQKSPKTLQYRNWPCEGLQNPVTDLMDLFCVITKMLIMRIVMKS